MKVRVQLDTQVLKDLRERQSNPKLKKAAECLRKRIAQTEQSLISMYSRIERTGIASPDSARRISDHFGVSVETLQGVRTDDLPSLWWIEEDGQEDLTWRPGQLIAGYATLRTLLEEHMREPSSDNNLERSRSRYDISVDPERCRLTLGRDPLATTELIVRAARRETGGIRWSSMTRSEVELLSELTIEIAYEFADEVVIAGRRHGPGRAYRLVEVVSADKAIDVTSRLLGVYADWATARRRLIHVCKTVGVSALMLQQGPASIELWDVGDRRIWRIDQTNNTERETAARAPWRRRRRTELSADLHARLKDALPGLRFVRWQMDWERYADSASGYVGEFVPDEGPSGTPP